MSNDKKEACYRGILFKLSRIEDQINRMSKGISEIKMRFAEELDPDEEFCPDLLESEKALLDSIEEMCLTSLLEREPEGDA
jgi:hypothetical protein